VVEASLGWSNAVLLTHLEVLAEVLVATPPVEVDHSESLVPSNLMDVGISEIVLSPVDWETAVSVSRLVPLVSLTDSVSPVLNHSLLSHLGDGVEDEGAHQMESNKEVDEPESVLSVENLHLPVGIANWVLIETSDVLECSPSLGIVTRLVLLVNKFGEVAIGVFGQRSK